MRRKVLSILLAAASTLAMSACGLSAPDGAVAATSPADVATGATGGEAITLVMAEVNPLDTIVGMTDQRFKEEVESRSGGTIRIDLQASGVLGSENDVLDTMLGGGGTIDISRISAFALTSYGGKKSMLLSLPYTFVSREHFWNFANSDLAQEFLREPSENGSGVRGLFYGEEGFRENHGDGPRGFFVRKKTMRSVPVVLYDRKRLQSLWGSSIIGWIVYRCIYYGRNDESDHK